MILTDRARLRQNDQPLSFFDGLGCELLDGGFRELAQFAKYYVRRESGTQQTVVQLGDLSCGQRQFLSPQATLESRAQGRKLVHLAENLVESPLDEFVRDATSAEFAHDAISPEALHASAIGGKSRGKAEVIDQVPLAQAMDNAADGGAVWSAALQNAAQLKNGMRAAPEGAQGNLIELFFRGWLDGADFSNACRHRVQTR